MGGNFRTHANTFHSLRTAISVPSSTTRLIIAEVQASNAGEIVDWDDGCPDWIELWNQGNQPFNATGWYLTDKAEEPAKWQLPELILSPNERVLIFASGLDFSDHEEVHTNFRLAKSGEHLHLVRPDGRTIDQTIAVGMPDATHGVSFGPSAHHPQPLLHPTPLEPNAPNAIGFTDAVKCSHRSCLYDSTFTITLECDTPGTVIRFTTDGSVPEEATGELYRGPLTIDHTTTIRARAFGKNRFASTVLTRSFIHKDELISQSANPAGFPQKWNKTEADYEMDPEVTEKHKAEILAALGSLPMVSVVAPTASVFGKDGIYSNSWERGMEWEVPAVIELLPDQNEPGFQAPCGLRIAGFESRRPDWKKHSLRISFRARYGLSVMDEPIFESLQTDAPDQEVSPLRPPAAKLEQNEDKLIDASHGLQTRKAKRFEKVVHGEYGQKQTKYLWTIDDRGVNLALDATPFPTPRGRVVHTNLSQKASVGGEAWFESDEAVIINANSGRFGTASGMSRAQWVAAIRYRERLGYSVKAIPSLDACSSLMLRSTDDSWASHREPVRSRAQYMRDQWSRMTSQEMGHLAVRGRFVHVCLNGLYWGLYNLVERPDEEYLAHQLGGKEDQYVTLRSRNRRIDTDEAGELVWDTITELANGDLNDPVEFEELASALDIVNLIDYCLIHMYTGNEDWALVNGNNMRAFRRDMQGKKLKFILWDADSSFASGWKNEEIDYALPLEKEGEGEEGSFTHLFNRLMTSEKFRTMFAQRVHLWCGDDGVLGAAACQKRYADLLKTVEPSLIAESARWGDIHSEKPYTPDGSWLEQKQRMLQEWFPRRSALMLEELRQYGLTQDSLPEKTTDPDSPPSGLTSVAL